MPETLRTLNIQDNDLKNFDCFLLLKILPQKLLKLMIGV